MSSLPAMLLVQRTETTLDTVANRFVRFVLERWRALASAVVGQLQACPERPCGVGWAKRSASCPSSMKCSAIPCSGRLAD